MVTSSSSRPVSLPHDHRDAHAEEREGLDRDHHRRENEDRHRARLLGGSVGGGHAGTLPPAQALPTGKSASK